MPEMTPEGKPIEGTSKDYVKFEDLHFKDKQKMLQGKFGEEYKFRSHADADRIWKTLNTRFQDSPLIEMNRMLENIGAEKYNYNRKPDALKAWGDWHNKNKKVRAAAEARAAKRKGGGSIRMGSGLGGVDPAMVTEGLKAEEGN